MSLLESERVRSLLAAAGLGGLSSRTTAAVLAVSGIAVALAVWRFWPSASAPEVAFDEGDTAPVVGSVEASEAPPAEVVVHVAGAVMRPGVYRLPPMSRVTDAIAAAGGPLGSAACDALNLARIVSDAERVYVPTQGEVSEGAGEVGAADGWTGESASAGAVSAAGVVDINRATPAELETLPGVGPATAQKIADDRETNGPFAKPEDLMRVPGVGPKKFEAMRAQVTCG